MQKKKKNITFIVNPISGTKSKDTLPLLVKQLIDDSLYECEIIKTEYAGHAAELASQCVNDHIDICVAVGGDGTVNEVARSLAHSETALGIIPCGSGNGLARHLCLPMDMKQALQVINAGKTDYFDYGVINDQPFFCTCGMGFDAYVSLKFAESGKRGLATYVENVLKEGLTYKPDTYIITDESGNHQYNAFLVACANASQYGNNAYIAPEASMQDGLLDVIIMEPFNIIEAAKVGFDLFAKTLKSNKHIKTFQARSIHIHRNESGAVHFDGDPTKMGTDIDVRIEPLGLKAIINPDRTQDDAKPGKVIDNISKTIDKIII
ncbi:diacylglycerol/lipid kinase family protein [Prevotella communis]|jgi:YegS/Rv2252/BmrU family lipid kinase|uniref:diacylglycerol/lipid kinase family protein n=1 Tax=Prevotella communis TaxID=2913614 RepID=UPI001EDAEDBA|nr:YegS/Rv2252/BmrU family lipid kinase [Prevotella communis]UKK57595.1 YegS/Rv2252/BmrU family lipid kinase [Prevotella communis]UKK60290.1 YegS/Rv2252/BmrU family lipid kinase [Prevotella communis]UKK68280.1 YegS/Rv2252/BmrU family lipid kinase [Prevotella communis]UKK69585.1 YegS/Rv2252/BmrU family lipid kinase [Prevotella communis]